jgi:hypothetical protein
MVDGLHIEYARVVKEVVKEGTEYGASDVKAR